MCPFKSFLNFISTYTKAYWRVYEAFEIPVKGKTIEIYKYLCRTNRSFERFKLAVKIFHYMNEKYFRSALDWAPGSAAMVQSRAVVGVVLKHYFTKENGACPRYESLVKYLDSKIKDVGVIS